MTPPDAYRYGRDPYDPADLIANAKATIARNRAAAEAARRDRQTGAKPDRGDAA